MSSLTDQVFSYKNARRGSWSTTNLLSSIKIRKKKKHKTEVMQYAVRFSLYAGNKTVRLGTQDWFQFLERRSLAYSHVFFCCLCLYKANHENSIKIIPDTRMNLLLKSKPYTEAWPFKNVLTRLLKTLSFFVSNRIYNVSMYNISTNSAGFFIFFFLVQLQANCQHENFQLH